MCWIPVANRGAPSLKGTLPPIAVSNMLTTRPCPTRQKRIGTSRMVFHTRYNSESILNRNDSSPGC